jgi:hypothetical protein
LKSKRRYLIASALLLFLVGGSAFVLATPPKVSAEAIQASVTRTPELMGRAWTLPVAATFQSDISYQSNGSLCGPASVANTFRSIGEAETTEAEVLDGTGKCWTGFCIMGLTLDELADVARAHTDRKVTVLRDLTPEAFLDHMRHANDPDRRYIVNFTRAPIFGGGGGHHSPIGGYLPEEDMVFVLDVNEAYKPWLIERQRLFEAMNTMDGQSKRGLLLIE